ncbi:MAG: FHA domain-containing protein [Candidatus Omnitrophica bacterium]|nr:FHA domain-containing protein [Candidatus Omnitrophota bacterium]
MGRIVLEIEEFAKTSSEYRSFDQDCIRIGRAFNNDLIINDPFVSPWHLSLKFVEGAWIGENGLSLNGVFVSGLTGGNNRSRIETSVPLASGDVLSLGRTTIHIWDIDQPVAPEQALEARAPLFFDPRKTMPSLLFALGAFCFICSLYLTQWSMSRNNAAAQAIAGTFLFLLGSVFWSGLWALITRFSKRQHRFLQHWIFTLHWAVIAIVLSTVVAYVDFFMCQERLDTGLSLVVFCLFGLLVLNAHLAIGTNLSFRKRSLISGFIVSPVILVAALGLYASHNEFNASPSHYIQIVPVPKKLIPVISTPEAARRLDSIF